jgi:hypothetical protein
LLLLQSGMRAAHGLCPVHDWAPGGLSAHAFLQRGMLQPLGALAQRVLTVGPSAEAFLQRGMLQPLGALAQRVPTVGFLSAQAFLQRGMLQPLGALAQRVLQRAHTNNVTHSFLLHAFWQARPCCPPMQVSALCPDEHPLHGAGHASTSAQR